MRIDTSAAASLTAHREVQKPQLVNEHMIRTQRFSASDTRATERRTDTVEFSNELKSQAQEPLPTPGDLTVRELLALWGQGDTRADLNADGTVDPHDLAMLLGSLDDEKAANKNSDVLPAPADTDAASRVTDADVSADSTSATAVTDSAIASSAAGEAVAPASTTDDAIVEPPPADVTGATPTATESLLAQWGTESPEFDYDGNGTVDAVDLAMLLGGAATASQQNSDVTPAQTNSSVVSTPTPDETTGAPTAVQNDTRPVSELAQRVADAVFTRHNKAADETISINDRHAPRGLVNRIDTDNDGTINRDDLAAAIDKSLNSSERARRGLSTDNFVRRWLAAFNSHRQDVRLDTTQATREDGAQADDLARTSEAKRRDVDATGDRLIRRLAEQATNLNNLVTDSVRRADA